MFTDEIFSKTFNVGGSWIGKSDHKSVWSGFQARFPPEKLTPRKNLPQRVRNFLKVVLNSVAQKHFTHEVSFGTRGSFVLGGFGDSLFLRKNYEKFSLCVLDDHGLNLWHKQNFRCSKCAF